MIQRSVTSNMHFCPWKKLFFSFMCVRLLCVFVPNSGPGFFLFPFRGGMHPSFYTETEI